MGTPASTGLTNWAWISSGSSKVQARAASVLSYGAATSAAGGGGRVTGTGTVGATDPVDTVEDVEPFGAKAGGATPDGAAAVDEHAPARTETQPTSHRTVQAILHSRRRGRGELGGSMHAIVAFTRTRIAITPQAPQLRVEQ